MPITNPKTAPILTETIAVRVSEEECLALAAIAQRSDRTISYVIRTQLREFLRNQNRAI